MTDPSSRLMKFRLLLHEYDFEVVYVRGPDNVAADALSRVRLTSEELKEMNEHVMTVLTRAQSRRLKDGLGASPSVVNIPTDDWTDHPRVVEIVKLPKVYTELIFVN